MRFTCVALLVAACGTDAPVAENGLDLVIDRDDHVAGAYTKHETSLVFDFSRDVDDGVRLIYLETANGKHLMTDVVIGGIETMNVLDGQLSISGPVRGEKVWTGDRNALARLMETSEMKLLPELRATLSHEGIDAQLSAFAF